MKALPLVFRLLLFSGSLVMLTSAYLLLMVPGRLFEEFDITDDYTQVRALFGYQVSVTGARSFQSRSFSYRCALFSVTKFQFQVRALISYEARDHRDPAR